MGLPLLLHYHVVSHVLCTTIPRMSCPSRSAVFLSSNCYIVALCDLIMFYCRVSRLLLFFLLHCLAELTIGAHFVRFPFGFRLSGFGFRISSFGFRLSLFRLSGFICPAFVFRLSSVFRLSLFIFRVSTIRFGSRASVVGFRLLGSAFSYRFRLWGFRS